MGHFWLKTGVGVTGCIWGCESQGRRFETCTPDPEAQLEERAPCKRQAAGSNPVRVLKNKKTNKI